MRPHALALSQMRERKFFYRTFFVDTHFSASIIIYIYINQLDYEKFIIKHLLPGCKTTVNQVQNNEHLIPNR